MRRERKYLTENDVGKDAAKALSDHLGETVGYEGTPWRLLFVNINFLFDQTTEPWTHLRDVIDVGLEPCEGTPVLEIEAL